MDLSKYYKLIINTDDFFEEAIRCSFDSMITAFITLDKVESNKESVAIEDNPHLKTATFE